MATGIIWYFFARLGGMIVEWQEHWAHERAKKRLEAKATEMKDDWDFTRPQLLNELRLMEWEEMKDLAEQWGVQALQQYPSGIVEAIDEALMAIHAKDAIMKVDLHKSSREVAAF